MISVYDKILRMEQNLEGKPVVVRKTIAEDGKVTYDVIPFGVVFKDDDVAKRFKGIHVDQVPPQEDNGRDILALEQIKVLCYSPDGNNDSHDASSLQGGPLYFEDVHLVFPKDVANGAEPKDAMTIGFEDLYDDKDEHERHQRHVFVSNQMGPKKEFFFSFPNGCLMHSDINGKFLDKYDGEEALAFQKTWSLNITGTREMQAETSDTYFRTGLRYTWGDQSPKPKPKFSEKQEALLHMIERRKAVAAEAAAEKAAAEKAVEKAAEENLVRASMNHVLKQGIKDVDLFLKDRFMPMMLRDDSDSFVFSGAFNEGDESALYRYTVRLEKDEDKRLVYRMFEYKSKYECSKRMEDGVQCVPFWWRLCSKVINLKFPEKSHLAMKTPDEASECWDKTRYIKKTVVINGKEYSIPKLGRFTMMDNGDSKGILTKDACECFPVLHREEYKIENPMLIDRALLASTIGEVEEKRGPISSLLAYIDQGQRKITLIVKCSGDRGDVVGIDTTWDALTILSDFDFDKDKMIGEKMGGTTPTGEVRFFSQATVEVCKQLKDNLQQRTEGGGGDTKGELRYLSATTSERTRAPLGHDANKRYKVLCGNVRMAGKRKRQLINNAPID